MALSTLAAFWGVSLLFLLTPGVDWAYTISAGLRGRRYIPAALGLTSGHFFVTLLVGGGIGVAIANTPAAMTVLTFAGAVYLLWLGTGILRNPSVPEQGEDFQEDSWIKWAIKGFVISGMNPKVFLLFVALLPQFTDPSSHWPLAVQMAVLGLLEVITCAVVYLLLGCSCRRILQTRPAAARTVSRLSGVLMIIIGTALMAEKLI